MITKQDKVFEAFVSIVTLKLESGLTLLGNQMFDTVGNQANGQAPTPLNSIFIPSTIVDIGLLDINLLVTF